MSLEIIKQCNVVIIRFTNDDIEKSILNVLKKLKEHIKAIA